MFRLGFAEAKRPRSSVEVLLDQRRLPARHPVVPGVAFGPALVVRGEVSPAAIAAFDGSALGEETALTAYDDAADAVAEGFARRADKASDGSAEMLTASAGLARDKGLRSAVRKHLLSGEDLLASVHAAVEQFTTVFTQMGGLMAERVTDLRDIERRAVARLVGEPEPGVQMPDEPAILLAEDLAPSDTATLDPRLAAANMDTLEDAAEAALAASDPMAARDAVRRCSASSRGLLASGLGRAAACPSFTR